MTLEIELKFSLPDSGPVLEFLASQNSHPHIPVQQKDLYFNHPLRNFAETDEALRIRVIDDQSYITYKGPVLDKQTKTRREIELPVGNPADESEGMSTILELLDFRKVRSVEKTRTVYHFEWESFSMEICLDEVKGLGKFLEIETIAEEERREEAQNAILHLAGHLNLGQAERRSYLRMLLEKENL